MDLAKAKAVLRNFEKAPNVEGLPMADLALFKAIVGSVLNLSDKAVLKGADGKIPGSVIPKAFDDIEEYESVSAFPERGEAGKLYSSAADGKLYEWSGTGYTAATDRIAAVETLAASTAQNLRYPFAELEPSWNEVLEINSANLLDRAVNVLPASSVVSRAWNDGEDYGDPYKEWDEDAGDEVWKWPGMVGDSDSAQGDDLEPGVLNFSITVTPRPFTVTYVGEEETDPDEGQTFKRLTLEDAAGNQLHVWMCYSSDDNVWGTPSKDLMEPDFFRIYPEVEGEETPSYCYHSDYDSIDLGVGSVGDVAVGTELYVGLFLAKCQTGTPAETNLVMPAAVEGRSRDLAVHVDLSDVSPGLDVPIWLSPAFSTESGEAVFEDCTFMTSGGSLISFTAGLVNVMSVTETAPHVFAVTVKPLMPEGEP